MKLSIVTDPKDISKLRVTEGRQAYSRRSTVYSPTKTKDISNLRASDGMQAVHTRRSTAYSPAENSIQHASTQVRRDSSAEIHEAEVLKKKKLKPSHKAMTKRDLSKSDKLKHQGSTRHMLPSTKPSEPNADFNILGSNEQLSLGSFYKGSVLSNIPSQLSPGIKAVTTSPVKLSAFNTQKLVNLQEMVNEEEVEDMAIPSTGDESRLGLVETRIANLPIFVKKFLPK
eukprot:TRINITY_DN4820_c1_g1_i1.p1 TRINITY_DN4820_c1_g1~~TRINITY_DN4820_c1_g1_i1.p1  ORF type:complete len:228 (-),score=28.53 TRINITY_DN4820_c1_g1_i1:78-761(-)